jgi:hypothetical protein
MRTLYAFPSDRWVDRLWFGVETGTFQQPWNETIQFCAAFTPTGGTLFIKTPGTYSGVGFYSNPIRIEAPAGPVTISN